tara:strand:- start:50921 stop:51337 length:417 start_codon:yes stop_codon:yes gene_type:complete
MKDKMKLAYMKTAEVFAECSPAVRLQVGAVLVKNNRIISCGYNALPAHLDGSCEIENEDGSLTTRHEVIHAEDNTLRGLIQSNESSQGSIIFITHAPCENCASLIVQSGIIKVFYRHIYRCDRGLEYLRQYGIEVEKI